MKLKKYREISAQTAMEVNTPTISEQDRKHILQALIASPMITGQVSMTDSSFNNEAIYHVVYRDAIFDLADAKSLQAICKKYSTKDYELVWGIMPINIKTYSISIQAF